MLRRGELAETLEQRIDAADAVAQRRQVLVDGRGLALHAADLLGDELDVQHHVVQRVLGLVRQPDRDALEQPRAIRFALLGLATAPDDPLRLLRHQSAESVRLPMAATAQECDFPMQDLFPDVGKATEFFAGAGSRLLGVEQLG